MKNLILILSCLCSITCVGQIQTDFVDFNNSNVNNIPMRHEYRQGIANDTIVTQYGLLESKIPIPKNAVGSISENTTPNTVPSATFYDYYNGANASIQLGYYLRDNGDGTAQINDATQTVSGDKILVLPKGSSNGTLSIVATVTGCPSACQTVYTLQ